MDLIVVKNLVKQFGDFTAVNGINFSGEVLILGKDPEQAGPQIRAHLGVVPQQDNLDEELTCAENLYIYGRYFGLPKTSIKSKLDELLEFAQLLDKKNSKVKSLSGGMKRRLTIARALVSDPDILMLDEPTTGLDPQARHILWDRLFRLKEKGVTLLITTHHMDEAEQLCDRLIVMDKGEIMAEGSPSELIKKYSTKEVLEVRFGSDRNSQMVEKLQSFAERLEELPDRLLLYTESGEDLLAKIVAANIHPNTSLVRRSSLEDVFLRLTGRSLIE
jgi:lipooligosaccharide transport system ATP-binding protein